MKSKYTAALLAFFLGGAGFHRFYLNQRGLGMMYLAATLIGMFLPPFRLFMFLPVVISFIDAISFLLMNQDEFDYKYNREYTEGEPPGRRHRKSGNQRDRRDEYRRERYRSREYQRREKTPSPKERREQLKKRHPQSKLNPFKLSGIKKFKDYDIKGAIEDFEKGLEISPDDISLHFNLACSHSLDENADKAYFHLARAVELGFSDVEKIRKHDALAYLRIHPGWDEFEENGFSTVKRLESPKEDLLENDQLLTQLNKLSELRKKGLITEEEFELEKKKLME